MDAPLGVRLDLRGECNRCGLCCIQETPAGRVVCEHLRTVVTPAAGNRRRVNMHVYAARVNGMAIRMLKRAQ